MGWPFLTLIALQALGAGLGWFLAPAPHATIGLLLGLIGASVGAFLLEQLRLAHLVRWLRLGASADAPLHAGLLGEAGDRVRRLLRARDQAAREAQTRLQDFLAALQASPNGVVMLDSRGQIEWFNQMAQTHFGLDPQRDRLQHFGNLVRDPGFADYLAGHDYPGGLIMPGRESSSTRPVKLSVHLHPYGDERLLLLSRDITAVEQAEAMRRDFVANVSHEIRTPLTVLAGFVETLQTLPLNEEERARYLALMAQQADRMQTLVSDLLTLSRLEGSHPPSAHEWTALPGLLRELAQEGQALSAALGGSGAVHTLTFDAALDCEIAGSGSELRSAMSNLLSNAIRYTPPGGAIQVRTSTLPDGRVAFSVADTGPGIAPEHLPRLTERFYRVDRSRSRDSGGTGLGLAIVKHVAQRHGAELQIDSTPGQGSTFTLKLPASRVRAVAGSSTQA